MLEIPQNVRLYLYNVKNDTLMYNLALPNDNPFGSIIFTALNKMIHKRWNEDISVILIFPEGEDPDPQGPVQCVGMCVCVPGAIQRREAPKGLVVKWFGTWEWTEVY